MPRTINLSDFDAFTRTPHGRVRLLKLHRCELCGEPTQSPNPVQIKPTPEVARVIRVALADVTDREPPEECWSDDLDAPACERCCTNAATDPGWEPPAA